jgi:hypothetical protein
MFDCTANISHELYLFYNEFKIDPMTDIIEGWGPFSYWKWDFPIPGVQRYLYNCTGR